MSRHPAESNGTVATAPVRRALRWCSRHDTRVNETTALNAGAEVREVVALHEEAGRRFTADGIGSFVRRAGTGDPVLLMHGLPASSFLYRKVIDELAAMGFDALSFDLPGLGLADRSPGLDVSIAGLGRFSAAAVDALGLTDFHLVVHDAGGPVGFELCGLLSDRVRSLTILNTMLGLGKAPYPGELLARAAHSVRGPMASPRVWRLMMRRVGIADMSAVSPAELDAYRVLALGDDQGAGYLRIMRRLRSAPPGDYSAVVDSRRVRYPVAVGWGARDPILPLSRNGLAILAATGLSSMSAVPGKHFLQEDQAPAVAGIIAANARRG